jgi:hypothetical protein
MKSKIYDCPQKYNGLTFTEWLKKYFNYDINIDSYLDTNIESYKNIFTKLVNEEEQHKRELLCQSPIINEVMKNGFAKIN